MKTTKKAKIKALDDEAILSAVRSHVKEGVAYTDTKLAQERKRVIEFYNAKKPSPVSAGNSKYVSMDVYDTVESMKAVLLEVFSAGSDIVQFSGENEADVPHAKQATEYTRYQVFRENDGHGVFNSVIHDGLTARVGIAKVYWDKCEETIEEDFEDLTEEQFNMLLSDPEVELVGTPRAEANEDEEYEDPASNEAGETSERPSSSGFTISGTICRRQDLSRVVIEPVAPEEFIVKPRVRSLAAAPCLSHRFEKTKGELRAEGYAKDLIEQIGTDESTLEDDPEVLARFQDIGNDRYGLGDSTSKGETERTVVVYETYIKLDVAGTGEPKLWKVIHAGKVVLDKEQVDRHPFKVFVPLPIPHSFYGSNFAEKVVPTQNAKTVLTRSILDHAVITNNPRYGVVKGALTNPRELLDNRVGGLVNMTRPDGVFPLPQAPLNPFIFQTIAMLDEDKEDTTGVSRLSQGLNKDAISKQNSQGMVEQLISASMQRQKIIARHFATQFLSELYHEVYRLCVENEKAEKIIQVCGTFVPMKPSEWRSKRHVSIDLRLGYGEQERLAQDYVSFHDAISQDSSMTPMYGPEQKFNVWTKVLEAKGHKDVTAFLNNPKSLPPPEPNPMQAVELQLKQQELKLAETTMALKQATAQQEAKHAEMKLDFEQRHKAMEWELKVNEDERKEREVTNRILISQMEIDQAQQLINKAPAENEKASAIISPNG